jgi:hypothetical protein
MYCLAVLFVSLLLFIHFIFHMIYCFLPVIVFVKSYLTGCFFIIIIFDLSSCPYVTVIGC